MGSDKGLGLSFRDSCDPNHTSGIQTLVEQFNRKTQVGGDHYSKLPIQPLEYALANKLGVMEHAVVKYVTRHQDKGGKQDLEKAIDYLKKMIDYYY